jgi:ribonuclease J
VQHAKLAVEASFDPGSILILENGDKVEFDGDILRVVDQVDNKEIYFSSSVHYEVSGEVIDERDLMSREGIVVITFTIDKKNKIIAGPIFNSKACTFSKNREWRAFCMMNTQPIIDSVEELFTHNPNTNLNECEKVVKNYMEKIIRQQIGKRPTLLVHADKVGA